MPESYTKCRPCQANYPSNTTPTTRARCQSCVRVKRHGKVGTQRRAVQIAVWYLCMWYLRNMRSRSRQRKTKKSTSMRDCCTIHTDTGSPPCKQTRRYYCARGWKRRGRATTARRSAHESTSSAAPLRRVQPRKKPRKPPWLLLMYRTHPKKPEDGCICIVCGRHARGHGTGHTGWGRGDRAAGSQAQWGRWWLSGGQRRGRHRHRLEVLVRAGRRRGHEARR